MAELMLHREVLRNFGQLPQKVQKGISDLIRDFHVDHTSPSIGLHSLKATMKDPKVRGANLPEGFRAIVIAPEKGDKYLLMHVDKHDAAYAWAKNKRFEIHGATGVFQVFEVEEAERAVQSKATTKAPPVNEYPLNLLSDQELFQAGVPEALIPSVRSINSDATFEALAEYLPQDCREVLYGIASGMTLDQALEATLGADRKEIAAHKPDSPGDFRNIDKTASFDLVLVEGEEALRSILEASLEEWRVFLHPYQRKLVEWKTNGPMNINGAAGTGKTVALMHRAVYLAKQLQDPKARILVTTFTTNLSVTLKHHIEKLAPGVAERIEVTNLHALARTICARSGWKGRIATDEDVHDVWEDVWQDPGLADLPMTRQELEDEYRLVVDANGIEDENAYLTTVRTGRPRVTRAQRKQAWPVFVAFQRSLKKRNLLTFEGAVHQARLAVEQGRFTHYAHVLVDEIQDFGLEALRLIRALSPISQGASNPLCTVGDGHQRIYGPKIPLSRAGIDVRGRSRRLKINYRTSQQIRQWAHQILIGMEIDDLNGGVASTIGDRSAFRGPDPTVVRCATQQIEADAVVKWVSDLLEKHHLASHEICVTPYKPEIRSALAAAGIPTYELKPRQEDPGSNEPGIRLGSMRRIKGLEFRAVAMACSDPADVLNRKDGDAADRCQRYVAASRAREYLLVTLADSEASGLLPAAAMRPAATGRNS